MTEEQILTVLEDTDAALVREALALFLAEGDTAPPSPEIPAFENFAEVVAFLKKNYGFPELDRFFTEAGLVYVSTGGRRVLLSDGLPPRETAFGLPEDSFFEAWPAGGGLRPAGRARQDTADASPGVAGKFPERFSGLEM